MASVTMATFFITLMIILSLVNYTFAQWFGVPFAGGSYGGGGHGGEYGGGHHHHHHHDYEDMGHGGHGGGFWG
uniref:Glycine-rich protein n=1 Tax=Panagrellus redivivus TaxID=6233 RepID=A0A7E4VCU5_PANRE